jgi:putative ABC transport system substrate-binding protein
MLAALPARAQQTRRSAPYRIGLLPAFDEIPGYHRDLAALLLELGWRQGAEFEFVHTGARYSSAELDSAARGMVAQRPDLILAVGTSYIVAAHRLTKTIPIVMLASGYPVEAGVAHSLARPGKNVTGNTIYAGTGVWGKFLELLREAKPGAKRVGMLMSYVPPGHSLEEIEPVYREVRQAAEVLGFQLQIVEIPGPDRVHAVLAQIEGQRPEALLLTSGQGVWTVRDIAMKFALKHRLPTVADFWWEGIEFPPLLVYAPDFPTLWRPALSYVVRILRDGEKPGELPIQQPAKFELGVSLKTAKAIGLELPRSLLLRADKVIE